MDHVSQEYYSAREIAEAALPDMPATTRGVDQLAKRLNWRGQDQFSRKRKGRGGGWEYSWKLFPLAAQKKLAVDHSKPVDTRPGRDEAWKWFDGLPDKPKATAKARLDILSKVEALQAAGHTKALAVIEVSRFNDVSERTIWNWFDLIEGIRRDDRLPYLAPRHRAKKRKATQAECSDEWWDALKADFLRLERPSFSSCYRRCARIAEAKGWSTLPERTARRRLNVEVPETTRILARRGVDALKAMYPPQTRDKTAFHAMEAVNGDFHKFDVFVRMPVAAGSDETEIIRPQMVAFQDIYSRRILSWRVDRTPNKTAVALALGDMIEEFGIPEHMLLDNGREFANKFLTGQTATRNRFKVKDDDIPGLMVSLGMHVHWATPYSGQSKPIERAFRDMCDDIAKDPRFAGAYTGNRPDAKPENYGSKAIDLETFLQVVGEGIEEHNSRVGRRTDTAQGRSFIETFEASYSTAPIRKATEEQRRLWLMGAEGIRPNNKTGRISFMKNEYWEPWLHEFAGQRVVVRFDPADLWAGLHVYSLENEYLGHVGCQDKSGFFDVDEARTHSRARRQWMTAERAALDAARKMKITDISSHLNDLPKRAARTAPVEAKIVRPVFSAEAKKLPSQPKAPDVTVRQASLEAEFEAARRDGSPQGQNTRPIAAFPKRPVAEGNEVQERFKRALEIEGLISSEQDVTPDERRWLNSYQSGAEYRAQKALYKDFGEGMFG